MSALSVRCTRLRFALQHHVKTLNSYFPYQGRRHLNKHWERPFKRELLRRRERCGPDIERHPSAFGIWSYEAELFSFGKRLGEEFDDDLLHQAFTSRSYVEAEKEKHEKNDKEGDVSTFEMQDNEILAEKGLEVSSRYIKGFLRYTYPYLFEEGISALHEYLLSGETLLIVGNNLGLRDLMLANEYPPEDKDYIITLLAVIGALAESQSVEKAEDFVKDFIISQLVGKDINEIWKLHNPMGALMAALHAQGRELPEPRLLWKSGSATIMAVYHVGIYCNKQLIGRSPGETVEIAEELAAKDALNRIMGTDSTRIPLPLSESVRIDYDKLNTSIELLQNEMKQSQRVVSKKQ